MTLTASANQISVRPVTAVPGNIVETTAGSFKEKYHLDAQLPNQLQAPAVTRANVKQGLVVDPGDLVTNPEGTTSRYAMAMNIFLQGRGAAHVGGFGAEAVTSEDGTHFYTKATTLNFYQQGYTTFEVVDDELVYESGQYVYNTEAGEKAYLYSAYLAEGADWPEIVDTFVLSKDDQGRYVSADGYYLIVLTAEDAELGVSAETDIICYGTNYVFTPLPADLTENVMPEDAEVFECQMYANSLTEYGDATMKDVTVGVKGDKVYVSGLSDYLPGSYLMGTLTSDNTITFDTHQYIGYYDEGDYPYLYEFAMVNPIYFDGESLGFAEAESVTMTINETRTLLTMEEEAGFFVCAYGDLNTWDNVYWNVMIGDFNQPAEPKPVAGVSCYGSWGAPYVCFSWDKSSVNGMPMNTDNLWCEVIINGEPYTFLPEYYEGLAEATTRVYYNTTGVTSLYPGDYTTLYFPEYEGRFEDIKTIGVKVGYESSEGVTYTDVVYASGFEPFDDTAYVPSTPEKIVCYKSYYNNFRFKFDGKDVNGHEIPERTLCVQLLLDGEPLVFPDDGYYWGSGDKTIIGLGSTAPNYNSSLVSKMGDEYVLELWGHQELPEFRTLGVRVVCTGGDTITYGDVCEVDLERAATPADPTKVSFDSDMMRFTFNSLAVDEAGNGLAPWNYGFEVYVNDELYVFKADLYGIENDLTVVPCEGAGWDIYATTDYEYDDDWNLIGKDPVMEISMDKEELDINKIGVRAVYTDAEGNTTYSNIVSYGSSSIGSAAVIDNQPVKWYNLQGIEVASPQPGAVYLRQQGRTVTKVYVK